MVRRVIISLGILVVLFYKVTDVFGQASKLPNVVFILGDEWRAQSLGYSGEADVYTPNLDRLADEAVTFTNAISSSPVCSPYRASLMTGQYPMTTGVFVNDIRLNPEARSLGKVFNEAGYNTGYIGKWHLDGNGRIYFIPKERRHGFEYWKVLDCSHDYNNSYYWGLDDKKHKWEGYDAIAQTRDAINYINNQAKSSSPFFLILSWGPPHVPFETAPESFQNIYRDKELKLRENVPQSRREVAQEELRGYYAHITALDSCVGALYQTLEKNGMDENTILVFTADHGAMVQSQGFSHKQRPYEESINVPLLIRYPKVLGKSGERNDLLITPPDIMPTLLGLCGLNIPESVEGEDKTPVILGKAEDKTSSVLISCYHPFGTHSKSRGGKEYRGIRTKRYTYVWDLDGPWLMFDNIKDPFQLKNLINDPSYEQERKELEAELLTKLKLRGDEFLPGTSYLQQWGYVVDETGTIPHEGINYRGQPIETYEEE